MSNTILAPFIFLLIPGLLFLILGKSSQPTASQRKRLRRGGILCGIAFTYFGLATILGTKMSARPRFRVSAEALRQYNGRRNQSSTFKVDYGGGETTDLTCGYNGTALGEGETVFVRYLEFDHSILYLRVQSRPNRPVDAINRMCLPMPGLAQRHSLSRERRSTQQMHRSCKTNAAPKP